jgi:2'-phosphotransferase
MLTKKQTQIGKKLCFILRHDIVNSGLICDSNGYVKVNDLIAKKLIEQITIDELNLIVENNDKKRFLLIQKNNEYYIKANQGHSLAVGNLIDDDITMELLTEPLLYCAHGTEKKYIESIYKNGLNRGLRKHIHLVGEIIKERQTSGFKSKSDRIILIDMDQCMKTGIIFYRSANNVILTEGIDGVIDPKYFIKLISV